MFHKMTRHAKLGLSLLLLLTVAKSAPAGIITPGDLIVADWDAFGGSGGLIRVDSVSGQQTVLTSGGFFQSPWNLTIGPNGTIFVADNLSGILQVNSFTGAQTQVSIGGYLVDPRGITLGIDGLLYITDVGSGGSVSKVIQLDPNTGGQTLLASGGNLLHSRGIAISGLGQIYIGDRGIQASSDVADGKIVRLDPVTGMQTVISAGGSLRNPDSLIIAPNGDLIVADQGAFGGGRIIRVDPATGDQTIISSGLYFAGGLGQVALAPNGDIFVADYAAGSGSAGLGGQGAVIKVDYLTGTHTVISQNGVFYEPTGLVIVPAVPPVPAPSALLLNVSGLLSFLGYLAIHSVTSTRKMDIDTVR